MSWLLQRSKRKTKASSVGQMALSSVENNSHIEQSSPTSHDSPSRAADALAGRTMSSATAQVDPYAPHPLQRNELHVHDSNSTLMNLQPSPNLGSNFNQVFGSSQDRNLDSSQNHAGSLNQAQQVSMENPTFYEFHGNQNVHYTLYNGNFGPTTLDRLAIYAMHSVTFDSSARDPPPRCHPGTRQDILDWIEKRLGDHTNKAVMSWLEGGAGAGKSAIMQTIAELEAEKNALGASLFFSRPNHRNDPHKVFTTLAYQLATKLPSYQEYLTQRMATDPAYLEKTMEKQFNDLIVIPFAEKQLLVDQRGYVILLDGLDECKGTREQRRIVKLIGNFVSNYRTVPLRWIIASRPEQHLVDAFSEIQSLLQSSFWERKVPIDSEQSIRDVELYLNTEFTRIRNHYDDLFPRYEKWPSESQFLTVSRAALGLFIFASTVIRFIDDDENPVRQLDLVLSVLGKQLNKLNSRVNPLALLDPIYEQILSELSSDTLDVAKLVLGYLILKSSSVSMLLEGPFGICHILGLEQHALCGALRKLRSVLDFSELRHGPPRTIRFLHASFSDFLKDQKRSHIYSVNLNETATYVWRRCMTVLHQWMKMYSVDNIELFWIALSDSRTTKAALFLDISKIWPDILLNHFGSRYSYHLLPPIEDLIDQLSELDFSYEETLPIRRTRDVIKCLEASVDVNLCRKLIRVIPLASLDRTWFIKSLYERGWISGTASDEQFDLKAEPISANECDEIEKILRTESGGVQEVLDLVDTAKVSGVVVKIIGTPSKGRAWLQGSSQSAYFPYIA